MRSRKYSDEQIREILAQARYRGNVRAVCRECGITEQTFYRWRKKFPDFLSDAQQLQALRKENQALNEIVTEVLLAVRKAGKL